MGTEASIAKPSIVGLSAITSLGRDWPSTWQALLGGKSLSCSFAFLRSEFLVDIPVSRVLNLDRECAAPPKLGAASWLAREVLSEISDRSCQEIRCYGASNHSESDILIDLSQSPVETSLLWRSLVVDPIPEYVFNNDAEWCYSACTSSLHALLAALMDFSDGASLSDAIVIGADALSAIGVIGFSRVGATTKDGCRPFSVMRDGILIGEGAAAIRLRHPSNDPEAVKLLGFGMSCDACHPTDPDSSGFWLEQAIRDAIRRSGCNTSDIAAIISHGTGTAKSDLVEAAVYERIWPGCRVPVTSIKGALGHSMGVAGLLNVLVAVEVARTGTVPPTAGSDSPAIGGLDLVQATPRHIKPSSPVLAVASGFGGNNCACVVGVEGP